MVVLILLVIGLVLFNLFSSSGENNSDKDNSDKTGTSQESYYRPPVDEKEDEDINQSDVIEPDITPPQRSAAAPAGKLPYYTKQVDITLETDELASCRYGDVVGLGYGAMKRFSNTGSVLHSTEITGLSEGQKYKYYIKCQDSSGNTNEEDLVIEFEVENPKDVTPPERKNIYPAGDVFSAGTRSTLISVSTNEPAYCRYDDEQGLDYNKMSSRFKRDDARRYHTATISGLEDGKSYDFFVRCSDEIGNKNDGDVMIHFSVSQ